MESNGTGVSNTATGGDALPRNTEGSWNTAIGTDALLFNTTGWFNTAIGGAALQNNTRAATIRLSAGLPLLTIPSMTARPSVRMRLLATPPAGNAAFGFARFATTSKGLTTAHLAGAHWRTIPVATIRPWGLCAHWQHHRRFNTATGSGALPSNRSGSCQHGDRSRCAYLTPTLAMEHGHR